MLNNFIGGGQVFLHKVRMLSQVFTKSITASILFGVLVGGSLSYPEFKEQDLDAAFSYRKAAVAQDFDIAMDTIRQFLSQSPSNLLQKDSKVYTSVDDIMRSDAVKLVSNNPAITGIEYTGGPLRIKQISNLTKMLEANRKLQQASVDRKTLEKEASQSLIAAKEQAQKVYDESVKHAGAAFVTGVHSLIGEIVLSNDGNGVYDL